MDASSARIANIRRPKVAIALGGGGARAIAHVLALEALDEMGICPVAIADGPWAPSSAACAAGAERRSIRTQHTARLAQSLQRHEQVVAGAGWRFADLVLRDSGNPVLLHPEICVGLFWPAEMTDRFEELAIKTIAVATQYLDRKGDAYDAGPLRRPVAGSTAIPGLFRPVIFGDEVLIDAVVIRFVFSSCGGRRRRDVWWSVAETKAASMFGDVQIMQGAITAQKIKLRAPDILMRRRSNISQSLTFLVKTRSCEPPQAARRNSNSCLGSG
jgi:NTE family protein